MTVINFDRVTKTYRLGSRGGLRETVMNTLSGLIKKGGDQQKFFNALDDVSFKVKQGEVLGLIGGNGAGKTTTLKLLSRVTHPTQGHISVDGRISALIELGAGFHPDLSGLENIYLNASILGLKKGEVDAKLDKIVAFSGLDKFLDTPVKRYSSGMYARLAFSVAAHVDPDVLLVDEVLSVGDALFQEKCLNRMQEIRDKGKAMVFISHNMIAVQTICSRVIWLEQGKIKAIGSPDEVVNKYLHNHYGKQQNILAMEEGEELLQYNEGGITIEEVKILDETGQPLEALSGGSGLKVEIHYDASRYLNVSNIQLTLADKQSSRIMGADLAGLNGQALHIIPAGKGVACCTFETSPIRPNLYYFNVDIFEEHRLVCRKKNIGPVIVTPDKIGFVSKDYNLFEIKHQWELNEHKNH